ncbi:hypothetical protein [Streptomyces sp. NPDC002644]
MNVTRMIAGHRPSAEYLASLINGAGIKCSAGRVGDYYSVIVRMEGAILNIYRMESAEWLYILTAFNGDRTITGYWPGATAPDIPGKVKTLMDGIGTILG